MLKTKTGFFSALAGIIFAIVFAFVLVGCGENGDLGEGEVTQEQWNAALGAENLENVSVIISANDADELSEATPFMIIIKFEDAKMNLIHTYVSGQEALNVVYSGEIAEEYKSEMLNILTELRNRREQFTFDNSDNTYKLDESITTTAMLGNTFTVTMNYIRIRFDTERPLYIQFDYMATSIDHESKPIQKKGTWKFTDYGTTTITKEVTQG